jgi:hypothetical protein
MQRSLRREGISALYLCCRLPESRPNFSCPLSAAVLTQKRIRFRVAFR